MRNRFRRLYHSARANIKSHHLLMIILTVSFLVIFSIWIFTSTSRSINEKSSSAVEYTSEMNSILGNVTVPEDTSEAIKSIDIYASGYTKALERLDTQLPALNGLESLLQPSKSSSYRTLSGAIDDFRSTTEEQIESIDTNLSLLQKFLNYSPTEDFASYGLDAANDSERIARASQAFTELTNNQQVPVEARTAITVANENLLSIKSSEHIERYVISIESAQETAINAIRNQNQQLKSDVSDFYLSILYQ
jgi:hypothetical protein